LIHYHGTPITPRVELMKLAGKHFCVSFEDPRDADWCLANGQSVLWDSGAFSAFTQGKAVDWAAYLNWLEPRLVHPHWAIIPDVIDAPEEQQRAMLAQWPFGAMGAPVWHMGLSIDYLLELADAWPRICFGSSGRYWQVGSDDWARRADLAFNSLSARHHRLPWVHMLRGLSLAGDKWPFASADSANVARNYKDSSTCPERMARRIDAVQCPARWNRPPTQEALFA